MCVLIRFESLIWKHKISISRQTTMSCHQSHTSTFSQPTYCNNWNIAARLDYFIYRCGGSSTGLTTSAYSSTAQYRTPYCDDKLHQGHNQHQTVQSYFCVVQLLREKCLIVCNALDLYIYYILYIIILYITILYPTFRGVCCQGIWCLHLWGRSSIPLKSVISQIPLSLKMYFADVKPLSNAK